MQSSHIQPRDSRLLSGLRASLDGLAQLCEGAHAKFLITSGLALLDELQLRTDSEFYVAHIRRGLEVLSSVPQACLDRLPVTDRENIAQAKVATFQQCDASRSFPALAAHIERLRSCFTALIRHGTPAAIAHKDGPFSPMIAWESEYYTRHKELAGAAATRGGKTITREALQAYLQTRFPERATLRVTEFTPLIGGFQKLTILFKIQDELTGEQSLVLRGEQPDRFIKLDLGEIPDEYAIVRLAFDAGLPVAEPLWVETDAAALGRRFMISRKVAGRNYGTAIDVARKMEPEAARSLVTTLAQLNCVPLDRYTERIKRTPLRRWLEFSSMADNTRANVHYWHDQLELRPRNLSPAIELIFRWLVQNVPQDELAPRLIHCDYSNHNVLIDNGHVTGILDWESARIGDPAEDLAYLLQSTNGHIDPLEARRWYQEASGIDISEFRLRYYDVHYALKVLLSCNLAASIYDHDPQARNEWTALALQWTGFGMSLVESKIEAAERAKRGGV